MILSPNLNVRYVQFFTWSAKSTQWRILNDLCKSSRSLIELRVVSSPESLDNDFFD